MTTFNPLTVLPLRAVLWDWDGTLVDSGEYHWLAWREALAAEGYDLTFEGFVASFGQRNAGILRGYLGQDLSDSEVERICAVKETHFRHLVKTRGIRLLPGVHRWLAHLRGEGWRQAIASSAPRVNIEMVLEMLDLTRNFDALVSAEDVQRGKPDPQVFLVAAERVAAPPVRCIVVEDAPVGVESAHRAGIRVIGVRSTHPTLEADWTVQTLDDLPEDAFDRLLRR